MRANSPIGTGQGCIRSSTLMGLRTHTAMAAAIICAAELRCKDWSGALLATNS
jgi:hypothetical protein